MAASSSSTKYKWDREKWEQDPTWWDPYNKAGRLKGKGRTTRARQERRALETPEERQARKAKRDQEALRLEKEASAKEAEIQLAKLEASVKEAEEAKKVEASAKEAKEAPEKGAAEAKPASAKEVEKDSKPACAKEVEKDSKAASAKEVEKDSKAASAKEAGKDSKATSAKEAGKDSKATFAKEVTLKSNAETASEKETGKGKKAATEKAMAPKATYKEVLQGWQEREKEAHEEQQWTVALGRKRKKRHAKPEASKPEASKPGGYVALGTSSSSSSSPIPAKPKPPLEKRVKQAEAVKKIAVDWHGVFEVKRNGRDVIPDSHIRALWDLEGDGWHTTLLSYAGWNREQQVRAKLNQMHVSFDEIIFVRERTGSKGKAAKALEKGITHIIDDNGDILWESLEKGLEILPAMSKWDEHWWAPTSKGIASHYDFPAAVKALIAGETYVV